MTAKMKSAGAPVDSYELIARARKLRATTPREVLRDCNEAEVITVGVHKAHKAHKVVSTRSTY